MDGACESICRYFTSALHKGVGSLRDAGYKPKKREWLQKAVIFYALEKCRNLLAHDNVPVWGRFSMGEMPKSEAKAKLRRLMDRTRGFHSLKSGQTKLSEYLVDFSFSDYKITELIGSEPMPPGGKFQLLLAAESEMDEKEVKVLEDFIKLIDVKSAYKVLVSRARVGDEKTSLINALQGILSRHSRYEPKLEPHWLFVGIPALSDWMDNWDHPTVLAHHVHILDPSAASPSLTPRDDLWVWEDIIG